MNMKSEFVVLRGKKIIVHSDKCKCSRRLENSFVTYGFTKQQIMDDLDQWKGTEFIPNPNTPIEFAPCAENKLELFK